MAKQNLIFITLDAVRPDHFSCYGYDRFQTKNIDEIAAAGARFENNICTSCLTPVAHASMLSGKYPNKTGVRHPFGKVQTPMVSDMLKARGYTTAGFVGINFLSSKHGFAQGFDYFNEPTPESSWNSKEYKKKDETMQTLWGNWWIPDMLRWMKENADQPFFIWAHYFEVHFLSEKWLLFSGELPRGELSDWAYYDAKLKYMDEKFIGPMNQQLKDLGIWDDTMIVLTSDHGETLGPDQTNWEDYYFNYPQHKTLYEDDLRVPLIVKGQGVPANTVYNQTTRAVDLVPTIMAGLDIPVSEDFDGQALNPLFAGRDIPTVTAYSEELYEERGKGSLQAVRTDRSKLIRNLSKKTEEFYDLQSDPSERQNLIDKLDQDQQQQAAGFRAIMDEHYQTYKKQARDFSASETKLIEDTLRDLGYI